MKTTKITSRNTKSEILAAYNAIAKELRAAKARANATNKAPAKGKMKALPPDPAAPTHGELSIGDIIGSLRALTGRIGDSASTLQTELTAEATTLAELRRSADTVKSELLDLHGIEVDAQTLDALLVRHHEAKEAADAQLRLRKEEVERELKAARDAWKKEQQERTRMTAEAANERDKAIERDAAEHAYALQQEQAKATDDAEQTRKSFELELQAARETKAEQWAERERRLQERETELSELKAEADAFEGQLEAAIEKAESEGRGIAKRQAKAKADLEAKDNDGVRRVFEEKIASLDHVIAKQDAQIDALSRQLEEARKQTTELAVKAIDGASNASSFEAVKEIALEQAKNTQKGK